MRTVFQTHALQLQQPISCGNIAVTVFIIERSHWSETKRITWDSVVKDVEMAEN